MNTIDILAFSFFCPFLAMLGAVGGLHIATALMGPITIGHNKTINYKNQSEFDK